MTRKAISPRRYLVITDTGRTVPVQVRRSGRRLMQEYLDLDFRGLLCTY